MAGVETRTKWTTVRIPSGLADRISALAGRMGVAYVEGRSRLPEQYLDHIPPHHVIERAVAEMEARRERSRKSRPGRVRRTRGGHVT